MDIKKVVEELKEKYPGKNIIINDPDKTEEVICEIEPASEHPDKSVALAVLDRIITHYHGETTETYEVVRGILELNIDGKTHFLRKGDKIVIKPRQYHSAKGKETWVKVTSKPGWNPMDHIIANSEQN
jgi:mannose-6-phosphate isomerase-like protein (cupin superfamily)